MPTFTYDLTQLELESGTDAITVKATATGYEDSPASNSVSYTVSSNDIYFTLDADTSWGGDLTITYNNVQLYYWGPDESIPSSLTIEAVEGATLSIVGFHRYGELSVTRNGTAVSGTTSSGTTTVSFVPSARDNIYIYYYWED